MSQNQNFDWKETIRRSLTNNKSPQKLNLSWKAFGLKEDTHVDVNPPNYLCSYCSSKFNSARMLHKHVKEAHPFKNRPRKKEKKKYKKVPTEQARKQRVDASKKRRTRIAKSRWPTLISSYNDALDAGMSAEDWGIQNDVRHPAKAISRWKSILKKQNFL